MRTLVLNALRLTPQRTAMGRNIEFLAQQWSRRKAPFDRIVLLGRHDMGVTDLGNVTPVQLRSVGEEYPPLLWEQFCLPWHARGASLLFCPSYTGPLGWGGSMVVANHGIYEAMPNEFSRLARFRATSVQKRTARRAARVIANSKATKADLVRFFRIPEARIETVYPAAHDAFFRRHDSSALHEEVVRTLGRPAPYVLFVGKLAKRRNVPSLIEAFAAVRKRHALPHHLLIVGPNTTSVPVLDLARLHGVGEAVSYHPYMDLEPLARLYAAADVFALPTVYEGISYTIFEAMASGTAVLTVDHPTLWEGPGDTVLSVPTPSVEDLVKGLTCLLTNPTARRAYAERGRVRARDFSWERVAAETMAILDREAAARDRGTGELRGKAA